MDQTCKNEPISIIKIFLIFLKLGCISFGGPIAHLGYFRDEFVGRLHWLSDHAYADLVALCQFLPGPASSQVGIALGLSKGGVRGALAAWLGFTLPSALLMVIFGLSLVQMGTHGNLPWIHGLKVVAVAVVAQALWGMGITLCPDKTRASVAVLACLGSSIIPDASRQVLMIVIGGFFGLFFFALRKPFRSAVYFRRLSGCSIYPYTKWLDRGNHCFNCYFFAFIFIDNRSFTLMEKLA